jgi:hypothetical protein
MITIELRQWVLYYNLWKIEKWVHKSILIFLAKNIRKWRYDDAINNNWMLGWLS